MPWRPLRSTGDALQQCAIRELPRRSKCRRYHLPHQAAHLWWAAFAATTVGSSRNPNCQSWLDCLQQVSRLHLLSKLSVRTVLFRIVSKIFIAISFDCLYPWRHPNNHTDAFRDQCLNLAGAIHTAYGQPYARCVQYLKDSVESTFESLLNIQAS